MKALKKQKKNTQERRTSNGGRRMADKFQKIILDNVPVSIITIDKDGYITSVNKYFKNFSNTKDYHNHNIFTDEFFIRENLVNDYKKLLIEGGILRRNHCHEINRFGEDRYMRIIAVPFRNKKGKIEGIVSLASDNTEATIYKEKLEKLNKELEKRVEKRTGELDKANKELVRALELKSIFMADVSHEFRTALTIIQCSIELLSKSCNTSKGDLELFRNVITEVERVSSMLTSLSLLTKTDSPNLKSHFEKINLISLITSICKELKVVADGRKVTIKFQDPKTPVEIMGSKEDLQKLISNLIRNAIKYNRENGWIKVWMEKSKDGVYLKVADSGIGIPESEFSNIFERFYRVDKARTRGHHDSGLGLAICKKVAEMHGGNISVVSKVEHGSTFTVYLPSNIIK